jgi:hypothetical protein
VIRKGVAPVRHAFRQPPSQSQPPFHAPQQQHSNVRRHLPAVKSHAYFLVRDRWQIEGDDLILIYDGCGALIDRSFDAASATESCDKSGFRAISVAHFGNCRE